MRRIASGFMVRRLVVGATGLVAACGGLPPAAGGPQPTGDWPDFFAGVPQAQVMMLGTFHFMDAGLDSYRPQHHIDVRTPERQREVTELVRLLAEFRPTKVAVEQAPFAQPRLDSLYAAYRSSEWELGANEVYQLGFRVAALLDHPRVYAVDAERLPYTLQFWRDHQDLLDAARQADAELAGRYRQMYSFDDSLKMHMTLREYLARLNHPDRIRQTQGHDMIGFFKADGETGYVGADAALGWYSRNLRIFRNLQRITDSPEERILVIMGSGHLPTLQFFADASPEYNLVDVRQYIGAY